MIYFPPCKINLGLHILQKRADGYHDLETGMLEIPFRDILEIIPSTVFQFTSSGLDVPGKDNSCIAAYNLMKRLYNVPPVHMHLHKIIPAGGGLGGGSSDSTYTLKALNTLFQLGLSTETIQHLAAELGSDNAFFAKGGLQLSTGRGEVLEPIEISSSGYHVCIVNIGIHVSTKEAFSRVVPNGARTPLKTILQQTPDQWKTTLVNDFEPSVFQLYPELETVKKEMYQAGAVYAAMSGSGSTLFGLFSKQPETIQWSVPPQYEKWVTVNFSSHE